MATGPDPDAPDWFAPETGAGNGAAEAGFAIAPAAGEHSKETEIVDRDDLSLDEEVRGGTTAAATEDQEGIIEASREPEQGGEPDFDGDIPGFSDWREELRERLKRIRARRERERLAAEAASVAEADSLAEAASVAQVDSLAEAANVAQADSLAEGASVAQADSLAEGASVAQADSAPDGPAPMPRDAPEEVAPATVAGAAATVAGAAATAAAQDGEKTAADGDGPAAGFRTQVVPNTVDPPAPDQKPDTAPRAGRPTMAATARDLIARLVEGRSGGSSAARTDREEAVDFDLNRPTPAANRPDPDIELADRAAANDLDELPLDLPEEPRTDGPDEAELVAESGDEIDAVEVGQGAVSGDGELTTPDAAEAAIADDVTAAQGQEEEAAVAKAVNAVEETVDATPEDIAAIDAAEDAIPEDIAAADAIEDATPEDIAAGDAIEDATPEDIADDDAIEDAIPEDIAAAEAPEKAADQEIDAPGVATTAAHEVDDSSDLEDLTPEPRRSFSWGATAVTTMESAEMEARKAGSDFDGTRVSDDGATYKAPPSFEADHVAEGLDPPGEKAPELDFDDDLPVPDSVVPPREIELFSQEEEQGREEEEKRSLEWDADEIAAAMSTTSSAGPLGERAAAALADLLVLTAIAVALVGAAASGTGLPFGQVLAEEALWLALTWSIFAAGYSVFFVGSCGQTIGRMVMRLRVVGADQFNVGFDRAAMRLAAWLVSALPLLAGMIPALKDPQRRGLHDRLSQTRVVKA